nr:MAG TPA: hypothetical protein [Caudoviricetes sp.]
MSDNNKSRTINSGFPFILCVAFTIVAVWFPNYIMWVVWAFVGYVAVVAVITIIALIVAAVMVYKVSKGF